MELWQRSSERGPDDSAHSYTNQDLRQSRIVAAARAMWRGGTDGSADERTWEPGEECGSRALQDYMANGRGIADCGIRCGLGCDRSSPYDRESQGGGSKTHGEHSHRNRHSPQSRPTAELSSSAVSASYC